MSMITADGISKKYGDSHVLAPVSFRVDDGGRLCIMGPSGSGKTTLLKVIAGLLETDTGSLSGVPEKIAVMFQEDRLCEDFSAISNIRLAAGREMSRAQIEEHLKEAGLSDSIKKPVKLFSGGMKRRLAIVRAMCYNAPLILMDEPFKGLDAEMKKQMMEYVNKYSEGKTLIYVTHDASEAQFLGGEIIEMSMNNRQ